MTNLEKLKEVLPNDWNEFDIPKDWAEEKYDPHPVINQIIQYYFGDCDLATTDSVWDKEVTNENHFKPATYL